MNSQNSKFTHHVEATDSLRYVSPAAGRDCFAYTTRLNPRVVSAIDRLGKPARKWIRKQHSTGTSIKSKTKGVSGAEGQGNYDTSGEETSEDSLSP